jgi:hypothetical protein
MRKALSRLKRELSEEELGTTGVQKMLIAEVERLDDERDALVHYRDDYYETSIKLAVSSEKLKEKKAAEIIVTACSTLGGAALGYAPAVWDLQHPLTSGVAIVIGLALILVGIAAKVVRQ